MVEILSSSIEQTVLGENKSESSRKIFRVTSYHIQPPQSSVTKLTCILEGNGFMLFHQWE